MKRALLFGAMLATTAFDVSAQDALSPIRDQIIFNALDADRSGKLEIAEINNGIIIGVFPEQFSFASPPKQSDAARVAKDPRVVTRVQNFFRTRPLKPAYEPSEISASDLGLGERHLQQVDVSEAPPKPRAVLRRNRDAVPAVFAEDDETKSDMDKKTKNVLDKGALFSYGRDFSASNDQWTTEGLLAWSLLTNDRNFGQRAVNSWLLFAQWERIDLGGDIARDKETLGAVSPRFKDKESNSLKLGVETRQQVNWPQIPGFFAAILVKAAAYWHTDFDFQSMLPTVELEIVPVGGKLGLGSFQTQNDALYWRLNPAIHFDAGHVIEDGEWTASKRHDTFAHVGPKIMLDLMPLPKSPLVDKMPIVFTIGVTKLIGLTNDSRDAHEYTADASIYVRKPTAARPFDPNVALSIAYKHLDDIENKKDDDSLIAGIAVGF